ncbi:MAG: hypothetical protein GY846_09775 [Deltaproteobacteria bacterium]|nr:hypothetical protein [Deltaproteobacteria bacterium]
MKLPNVLNSKMKCSDCLQCQMCGETRCRICRKSEHKGSSSGLGAAFTHGEYLAWKKKKGEALNG